MTYKQNRKIKVYILIIITIFILLNNFQLIFNTRNIFKNSQENGRLFIFLQKKPKTEDKPKIKLGLQGFLGERTKFLAFKTKYKEENRTISTSRELCLSDKAIFIGKRLINLSFNVLEILLVSVKKWYFDLKKHLLIFRKLFLWVLEKEIFPRGRPLAR